MHIEIAFSLEIFNLKNGMVGTCEVFFFMYRRGVT